MNGEENYPFECNVDDCDGSFKFAGLNGYEGPEGISPFRLETTCEHDLDYCAYCERVFPAGELYHVPKPGANFKDGANPRITMCGGCLKANRIYTAVGWEL